LLLGDKSGAAATHPGIVDRQRDDLDVRSALGTRIRRVLGWSSRLGQAIQQRTIRASGGEIKPINVRF
jgi:hypothetical protein